jgi:O-antigen/teichoic acid export membrane protein
MISLLSLVVCPLSLGLAAVAPLVVQVFLGEQWLPSTGLIQILAFVGLLKALSNPAGSVMLAKGRADIGFKWNLAIALSNFIVFGFAVRWGVETLAWTYLVIMIIYFGAFQLINGRLINLSLVQYAKTLLPSLLMSLLMTSVVLILKKKLLEVAGGFSIVFQLIILVGSGTIVYSLLVFWQFRPQLMDVYRLAVAKGGDDA